MQRTKIWTTNSWITIRFILANDPFDNRVAKQTFLGQLGKTISRKLYNVVSNHLVLLWNWRNILVIFKRCYVVRITRFLKKTNSVFSFQNILTMSLPTFEIIELYSLVENFYINYVCLSFVCDLTCTFTQIVMQIIFVMVFYYDIRRTKINIVAFILYVTKVQKFNCIIA